MQVILGDIASHHQHGLHQTSSQEEKQKKEEEKEEEGRGKEDKEEVNVQLQAPSSQGKTYQLPGSSGPPTTPF